MANLNKVMLKPGINRKGIHTHYAGDTNSPKDESGAHTRTVMQSFLRGRADNVPSEIRDVLKKLGVV